LDYCKRSKAHRNQSDQVKQVTNNSQQSQQENIGKDITDVDTSDQSLTDIIDIDTDVHETLVPKQAPQQMYTDLITSGEMRFFESHEIVIANNQSEIDTIDFINKIRDMQDDEIITNLDIIHKQNENTYQKLWRQEIAIMKGMEILKDKWKSKGGFEALWETMQHRVSLSKRVAEQRAALYKVISKVTRLDLLDISSIPVSISKIREHASLLLKLVDKNPQLIQLIETAPTVESTTSQPSITLTQTPPVSITTGNQTSRASKRAKY
jgi:hypothetical protein